MSKHLTESRAWVLLVVSFILLVCSSVALVIAVSENNHLRVSTDQKICRSQNRQNALIEKQLRRSLKTLPTITYYKQHTDELTAQINLIHKEIDDFGPILCP